MGGGKGEQGEVFSTGYNEDPRQDVYPRHSLAHAGELAQDLDHSTELHSSYLVPRVAMPSHITRPEDNHLPRQEPPAISVSHHNPVIFLSSSPPPELARNKSR